MNHRIILAALACSTSLALAACEEQGPVERAGEEIDEAADTLKRGEESPASKADDLADEVREGAREAKDEIKEN